jgi:hypothetical protein
MIEWHTIFFDLSFLGARAFENVSNDTECSIDQPVPFTASHQDPGSQLLAPQDLSPQRQSERVLARIYKAWIDTWYLVIAKQSQHNQGVLDF